jgi:hypothetical protein
MWRPRNVNRCNLCIAKGLKHCEVLQPARRVDEEHALLKGQELTGTPAVVDISKAQKWIDNFKPNHDIDYHIVHLVCHPCKYMASGKRRKGEEFNAKESYSFWVRENRRRARQCHYSKLPWTRLTYECLAGSPKYWFSALCERLGFPYEPDAHKYWEHEHHGPAGNGAASVYLRHMNTHYKSADENFYSSPPIGADKRWVSELTEEERAIPDIETYGKFWCYAES